MRKLLPLLLVFVLVFAACGGDDDDDGAASIEDAETCEDVGDVFIDEIQTLLDELSDMSIADLEGSEQPEIVTDFQANVEEIGAKSEELGCSEEDMTQIITDRVGDLEAEGELAKGILQGIQESVESGTMFE